MEEEAELQPEYRCVSLCNPSENQMKIKVQTKDRRVERK